MPSRSRSKSIIDGLPVIKDGVEHFPGGRATDLFVLNPKDSCAGSSSQHCPLKTHVTGRRNAKKVTTRKPVRCNGNC